MQYVWFGNHSSVTVTYGVPQGKILGPVQRHNQGVYYLCRWHMSIQKLYKSNLYGTTKYWELGLLN